MKYFVIFVILLVFTSCNEQDVSHLTVGFYNVENLFDTINNPNKHDEQYTPSGDKNWDNSKYITKLKNLAKVISQLNNGAPEFLGICEVENRTVLEDLISQKDLKVANYKIAHIESPDERGIDVGLLYNKKIFSVKSIEAFQPDLSMFDDKTRDVLLVSGNLLNGEKLHFIINHWPSRGGGLKKSEPKRLQAAKMLNQIKQQIFASEPNADIIVMGDFNDEPSNKSISEILDVSCTSNTINDYQLYNPFCTLEDNELGSYKYRKWWDMLDQIMVSKHLTTDEQGVKYKSNSASIKNEHWMQQHGNKYEGSPLRTFGGPNYLGGYSDHFPVYIELEVKSK